MKLTEGTLKRVFERVAPEYGEIEAWHVIIDNCAHQLVKRPEQFLHPGVNRIDLRGCQQSSRDARLVGDHPQPQPLRAQPVEGLAGTGQRLDLVRVPVVGHVPDKGAVPIEENGIDQLPQVCHMPAVPWVLQHQTCA